MNGVINFNQAVQARAANDDLTTSQDVNFTKDELDIMHRILGFYQKKGSIGETRITGGNTSVFLIFSVGGKKHSTDPDNIIFNITKTTMPKAPPKYGIHGRSNHELFGVTINFSELTARLEGFLSSLTRKAPGRDFSIVG